MDFLNYIYPNAKPLDRSQIKEGDIVAFDSEYGRGVALMQDGSWFHSSYNLVEKNRVWVSDSMPDDIQLFTPTKEDILLAIDYLEGPEAEDEYGMNPHEILARWNHKAIYKLEQAVNDLAEINLHVEDRWENKLNQAIETISQLREQISVLVAEVKEKDEKIDKLETQLNEMSKLSAGVAKKSSQDDVLKAMRTYLNISKRKTLSKREAAKTVFMDLFTSTKLDLPDDIKELLTYLDDEQAEPKVVNVAGNYNDIHDNGTVNNKD